MTLRVLYVADAQSPHSVGWIRLMAAQGVEIHLVTTYPVEEGTLPVASLTFAPWDFSAAARAKEKGGGFGHTGGKASPLSRLRGGKLWNVLVALRARTAPGAAVRASEAVAEAVDRVKPDLVHALRTHFEGAMAARALRGRDVPLLCATWGNDFTLFAAQRPVMRRLTEETMRRADGLLPDCRKDLRLAAEFGWDPNKPSAVLPGNGGIRGDLFHPGPRDPEFLRSLGVPPDAEVIVNARGIKTYTRTEAFFASIPMILRERPNAWFVGVAMADKPSIAAYQSRYGGGERTSLLGALPFERMGDLFRAADAFVSLADHDGTPNSVVEGMACGSVPVAGDIESLREWVDDGDNGLLLDHKDPAKIAAGVVRVLSDRSWADGARAKNVERAKVWSREEAAPRALDLYERTIRGARTAR